MNQTVGRKGSYIYTFTFSSSYLSNMEIISIFPAHFFHLREIVCLKYQPILFAVCTSSSHHDDDGNDQHTHPS